jgi:hypothetical protein
MDIALCIIATIGTICLVAFAFTLSNGGCKSKGFDYKTATKMAKAQLEWMKTPEYEEYCKRMSDLECKPPIYEPLNFGTSYWTKSKDDDEDKDYS